MRANAIEPSWKHPEGGDLRERPRTRSSASLAPPLVLSIAGFDPTSGAGISADLKAFAANHTYGLACISCLTVQDTRGVYGFKPVDAGLLDAQLACLLEDVQPRAIKIGMLGTRAVVEVVVRRIELARERQQNGRCQPSIETVPAAEGKSENEQNGAGLGGPSREAYPLPWVVLDPIYSASHGVQLCDEEGWEWMRERLFPLTGVLTPNLPEAERLTGMTLNKPADMERAALKLQSMGPMGVVVTGGHLERPVDVVYDGSRLVTLTSDRVRTSNTHGTGCTFSAALAANLASGKQIVDAVVMAKAYVTAALKQAYAIGSGPGPLNHLYRLQESLPSRNVDPAPLAEYTTR